MSLKNFSKQHLYGLLIGILVPIILIPLVILILSWAQNFMFEQLWYKFLHNSNVRAKVISITLISNLIWFYLFLNREKWNWAMGVILGTILFLPYVIYVLFIA